MVLGLLAILGLSCLEHADMSSNRNLVVTGVALMSGLSIPYFIQNHGDMLLTGEWFITPPRNRGEVVFSLQFSMCVRVCVCVCACVCVCMCLSVYSMTFDSVRFSIPLLCDVTH